MTPTKRHFYWIDIAKAVSIFGVVYIHSGLARVEALNISEYFRFCVPLFIMISFFLSEHSFLAPSKTFSKILFLKKRLTRLVIPYVLWTSVYAVGQFHLGILPTIDFGPTFAWQGQYFFVILIQLTLLYPWIRLIDINKEKLLILFGLTLALYIASSYFSFSFPFFLKGESPFYYWIFYLFLSIYLARNQASIQAFTSKLPTSIAVISIILLPCFIIAEAFLFKSSYAYSRVSVLLVSVVLMILYPQISTPHTHQQIKHWLKPLKPIVHLLSRYSLGVFCINPIIISTILEISNTIGLESILRLHAPVLLAFSRLLIAAISCSLAVWVCSVLNRIGGGLLVK